MSLLPMSCSLTRRRVRSLRSFAFGAQPFRTALIVAFNVRTERAAESLRNDKYKGEVDILSSKVIYSLIGDVTAKVEAAMPPITEFRPLGQATVAQRFSIPVAKGKLAKGRSQGIAGCRVVTGTIVRQANVRVVRDGIELWKGKLEALKQHKEDKESVGKGQECGLAFDGWDGFDVGDVVEASEEVEIKQRLGV